jgi:hypothetical protein
MQKTLHEVYKLSAEHVGFRLAEEVRFAAPTGKGIVIIPIVKVEDDVLAILANKRVSTTLN